MRRRKKQKNDPRYIAAARELRDRYLEHVNGGAMQLEAAGKYDVSRQIAVTPADARTMPLLEAA